MSGSQVAGGRARTPGSCGPGLLVLGLGLGLLGCVSTTRRIEPDIREVLAVEGLEIVVPPGWRLDRSPLAFLDATLLHLTSPDGLVVAIEVSAGVLSEPDAHLQRVLEQYRRAFPHGRFHPVREAIGTYETCGFDGVAFQSGDSGQRMNVFYRCLSAEGRTASFQGQTSAAVWAGRSAELQQALATFRMHPRPAAR